MQSSTARSGLRSSKTLARTTGPAGPLPWRASRDQEGISPSTRDQARELVGDVDPPRCAADDVQTVSLAKKAFAFRQPGGDRLTKPVAEKAGWREWLVAMIAVRDAVGGVPPIPTIVWLGGAAVMMLFGAVHVLAFRKKVRSARPAGEPVDRMVREAAETIGLRRIPRTWLVEEIESPACAWFMIYTRIQQLQMESFHLQRWLLKQKPVVLMFWRSLIMIRQRLLLKP